MATITTRFDPIDYAKQLRNAGVSQEQAEIQAQAIEHVINDIESSQNLVTNEKLDKTIAELKFELIKWIIGTGVASFLAIAGLLKFMIHS